MDPGADTVLIGKCLSGDVNVYQELVDKYSSRIVNVAYMMIGDRHDAEDVDQDAFIRAYKALPNFRHKAKFSSWLYQIYNCRHLALCSLRQMTVQEPVQWHLLLVAVNC